MTTDPNSASQRGAAGHRFRAPAFLAANSEEAEGAVQRLSARYGNSPLDEADVIIAVGGDGFMLRVIHWHLDKGLPIFGLNQGTVGFLMNVYDEEDLVARVSRAQAHQLTPLKMTATGADGSVEEFLAINEVSVFRTTAQALNIRISVDGRERLENLVCDGVLVASPAGSTAYNMSAYGPILPLESRLLALTPISAYRPRRWRGALLPHEATVTFDIRDSGRRTANAAADYYEVKNVVQVTVREDWTRRPTLLFDPEHNLEERIIAEQFMI